MHSIKEIIENGSIGLMNTRSSKGANVYKAYTTIGSGTRAEASALSTRSFELKEEDIKRFISEEPESRKIMMKGLSILILLL